jgi:hypothetical protein
LHFVKSSAPTTQPTASVIQSSRNVP